MIVEQITIGHPRDCYGLMRQDMIGRREKEYEYDGHFEGVAFNVSSPALVE